MILTQSSKFEPCSFNTRLEIASSDVLNLPNANELLISVFINALNMDLCWCNLPASSSLEKIIVFYFKMAEYDS